MGADRQLAARTVARSLILAAHASGFTDFFL
jgi:hypothetical protein